MNVLDTDYVLVPWPTAGDVLLQEDANWENDAFLNLGGKDWESYANGYKEAADVLCQRFLENQRGLDALVFPIVLLYRHYLGLRLKMLISGGQELLDQRHEPQHGHRLDALWITCRRILQGIWPQDPTAHFGRCRKLH